MYYTIYINNSAIFAVVDIISYGIENIIKHYVWCETETQYHTDNAYLNNIYSDVDDGKIAVILIIVYKHRYHTSLHHSYVHTYNTTAYLIPIVVSYS